MIDYIVNYYQENILSEADPRTRHWFLINSNPIPCLIVTLIYLLVVYYGIKAMKNYTAFQLTTIMAVYNFGLVILSLYVVVELLLATRAAKYEFWCQEYNDKVKKGADYNQYRVACVLWWHFISKAIEMFDTVLMILRKKNNQITFLHVYHHSSVLIIWWLVVMFMAGGSAFLIALVNSFVHVVMYSYYGLSAFPSLRKFLWWKRYITKLQLVQFFVVFFHTVNNIYIECDFPNWGRLLQSGYLLTMVMLFCNFYLQTYLKRRKHIANGTSNGKSNGYKKVGEKHE